ncbi:AAA family ATPase [Okeania sp. SIO1I7]|uniref:AAA family ATPase n=1 Tax=Okeania sp. SIO1I7 TaxID=2607772 RepID=UPI0013F7EF9C|nr:ATP-binding protein [Okeania sp. SIO1I7]NET29568.1 AAA family ATPase [Okeania sp. SIO1I7]
MLKQITLENWKSFRHAELYIDPLTVLIGTNASGKSNVVDALDFLNSIMQGTSVEAVLTGDRFTSGIRGGVEWAVRKPETKFSFQVLVDGENEAGDYLYKITIETQPTIQVIDEYLTLIDSQKLSDSNSFQQLFFISSTLIPDGVKYQLYEANKEFIKKFYPTPNPWLGRFTTKIPFYEFDDLNQMMFAQSIVPNILKKIFILNPIPSQMRDYSPLSKRLERDGSNIAGVLAALPEKQKAEVEEYLLKYLAKLPEGDMKKVWAETVGRLGRDAMLYCEEIWHPNQQSMIVDACGMSDGTLRFLAILTAMLTQPEKSLIVIEEVDNGLHPSRAGLLLQMLREIGDQRQIDVLVTTHNSALLDELTPKFIPFVMVTYRDKQTGESQLIPLEDIEDLPKLMASGTLGKIASKGLIEKSLKAD